MRNKKIYNIALGGMVAALSLVLMFMAVMFPFTTFALPAAAGVLLIAVVLDAGTGWAFLIYAAVSILSLFMSPDRDAAVYYIAFFGHYPVVKNLIERLKSKSLQWIIKIAVFNVCILAAYALIAFIGGIPKEFTTSVYIASLIVLLNVTFVIYDIALSRIVMLYIYRFKQIFKRKNPNS